MSNKEPTIKQMSEMKRLLHDKNVPMENRHVRLPNSPVTKTEIQDCITKTKTFIKQLRASAKEQNNRADELAKSNGVLVKQLKELKKI